MEHRRGLDQRIVDLDSSSQLGDAIEPGLAAMLACSVDRALPNRFAWRLHFDWRQGFIEQGQLLVLLSCQMGRSPFGLAAPRALDESSPPALSSYSPDLADRGHPGQIV